MARARQIKPTFFMHEVVAMLSHFTRLYWIGLWTLADREGRLEYRPMRIKAQLFPYEGADIEASTLELESKGFVQRCKLEDGRVILHIINWHKHQKPHQNETQSEFPPLDEALQPSGEALSLEPRTLNPEPRTLNPEPRTLNPETPAAPEAAPAPRKRGPAAKKADSLEDILRGGKGTPTWEAYWKLVGTFGGQLKNPAPKTTARLYVQALDAGATLEQIQAKADTLRAGTSEIRYMPQLQKWLEGQGYLTPDLPTTPSQGGTHGPARHSTPHHRSATDASFAQQLQAHRAQHGPVRLAGEGNAEELQRLLGAD